MLGHAPLSGAPLGALFQKLFFAPVLTGVVADFPDYPFVQPSADVKGLAADFWLAHDVRSVQLPLRLAAATGFDRAGTSSAYSSSHTSGVPVDPVNVLVLDAADTIIFDSTGSVYYGRLFSASYFIHEWRTSTAVCRLLERLGLGPWPAELTPAQSILDERTHELLPERVRSLRVNGVRVSGRLQLQAGFNAVLTLNPASDLPDLAATAPSVRARTEVSLALAPGTGQGVSPGCADTARVLRRLNGVGPDARGNLQLSADGCYWLRPATEDPQAPLYQLGNDCGPGCADQDYASVYQAIAGLVGTYRSIGAQAESVRDAYADGRERWLAAQACLTANPLKLLVRAEGYCAFSISGSFTNLGACCLTPLELRCSLSLQDGDSVLAWPGTARIIGGSVLSSTYAVETAQAPQGTSSVLRFSLGYCDPGSRAAVKVQLLLPGCNAAHKLVVTLTAHAPPPSPSLVDNVICTPPAVTVPAPVLAQWAAAGVPAVDTLALLSSTASAQT